MPLKVLPHEEPDACASKRLQSNIVASLVFTAFAMFASVPTLAATMKAPPISINGNSIAGSALERGNTVFVPATGYFEKLGADVSRSGDSFVARTNGKNSARLTMGSRNVVVNGAAHTPASAPSIAHGVAMLPLRSISEATGARVASAPTAGGGAAAATVAQAAAPAAAPAATTDATATNAPATADSQSNASGVPWWLWALIALLVVLFVIWLTSRRKKEPIITTSGSGRSTRGNDPTNTRK